MSKEYERLMREYQIPPGTLTAQQLKLLQQGGIRLDDSDDENDYSRSNNINKNTRPKIPSYTHQNSENQAFKQIYENQLSKKDKQIWYLQNQSAHRQKIWEAQKVRLQQEYQIQVEKLLAELRRARAQIVHSEGQIPLIKQAINRVRQMLSGMQSDTVYARIKDIPERDLPPSQWLLVNVWQLVYPYKKQLDLNRKQTVKLREEIKMMNDRHNTILTQLDHYQRLLISKDDDEKRHSLNFDNNRKCLQLEIDKLRQQCQLLREKGARYDELFRDYQFTKQEKQLIEEKLGFYDKNMQKQVGGNGKLGHQEQQRRKIDLLSQDKQYLTKQNIQLIQKQRRLQDRLDRLEAQLLNAKNESRQYLSQLLNLKTDSVANYEQKIYREISQLKQKHTHELEMARNNLIGIYEQQINFQKQNISQKQLKITNLERQLRQKTKQNQQMMIDTRSFQRKFDGDLSQARLSLRIKTQQLDRISIIYNETLQSLNSHKIQNQMLRQKLNCLKGECYKAEANSKDQMSSLKAQVAVLREQLVNYQLIQKQIDEAIVSLGKLNPNDNAIFTSTISSVPTSSKRRIQQALGLAQRLQAKQKEHEQTLQNLRKRQAELEQAREELRISKSILQKTNQPYSYLVNNIEEREKQIMMLRKDLKRMEQDYNNMREEHRSMARQLEEAQRDIQRLLLKRQSIQNIQKILIDLTRGPTSTQQINSAVDEIREILGSTQPRPQAQRANDQKGSQDVPQWYKKLVNKRTT